MARIRSVKPELRTSLTATQWPREVRLFWVLLWGYLDDHGYGVDEPRLIKPDCFPLDDDLSVDDIDKWLTLIASCGSLCRFEGPDGRRYLHAPKWADHQRPQHPATPKYPACSRSHEDHMTVSGESHETFMSANGVNGESAGQSTSGDSHETFTNPREGLTPEGVVERGGGGGGGGGNACGRTRAATTLLGNSLLDEHRRLLNPRPPRAVAQRLGDEIDRLLDDPDVAQDEIQEALARMRANPKLGPGVLPSLVHEVRQERAHPELARQRGRHQSTGAQRAQAAIDAGEELQALIDKGGYQG